MTRAEHRTTAEKYLQQIAQTLGNEITPMFNAVRQTWAQAATAHAILATVPDEEKADGQ